jgi:hypothetical protein
MRLDRVVDRRPEAGCLPGTTEEVEVEGGMQLVRPQVTGEPDGVGQPDLADQNAGLRVAVGDRAPTAVNLVELVPVGERVLSGAAVRSLLCELGVLTSRAAESILIPAAPRSARSGGLSCRA